MFHNAAINVILFLKFLNYLEQYLCTSSIIDALLYPKIDTIELKHKTFDARS